MKHLTPDEVVDAVEQTLAPARRDHAARCDDCSRQIADLSRLLAHARAVEVPEPSPLFWDRLSDRVRIAIGVEPAAAPRPRWFAWPVMAPVAALALIVVALSVAVSRQTSAPLVPSTIVAGAGEASSDADSAELEAVWALAADLVGGLDDSDAHQADLVVSLGSAERAAGELSVDEQAELVRLLQQELGRSGG
jgi:hypothetical protein